MRIVHGDKELMEKLGRNDLCPCGSHCIQVAEAVFSMAAIF